MSFPGGDLASPDLTVNNARRRQRMIFRTSRYSGLSCLGMPVTQDNARPCSNHAHTSNFASSIITCFTSSAAFIISLSHWHEVPHWHLNGWCC